MNVTFEKLDNVNGCLTVSVAEADYAKERDRELQKLQATRTFKGFRPGKAPKNMVMSIFGGQVMSKVVDKLVSEALNNYISENKLPVLAAPLLQEGTKVNLLGGGDFEFRFDVGLRPEISLNIDESIHIPYYTVEVTDEMVAERCASYRHSFSRMVPGEVSEPNSLVRGAIAELNDDGTQKDGGITNEVSVVSPRYLADDEQRNLFVGVKVGDDLVFNPHKATGGNANDMSSILNIDKEGADAVTADFRFTVTEVMVNRDAEIDQQFFDDVLGKDVAKSEEEFNEKLRESIANEFTNDSNYRFSIDSREQLLGLLGDVELPDAYLIRYFASQDEKRSEEEIRKDYPEIRKDLLWEMLSASIGQQFAVEVTDDDLHRYARFAAARQFAQYGMMNVPDDALNNMADRILENQQTKSKIHTQAMTDKIYAAVRDHVSLDRQTLTLEAFNQLFKDDASAQDTDSDNEPADEGEQE